jgi:hypothetical protein
VKGMEELVVFINRGGEGSVTIHNLRTVAPRYGELLALLVYLTDHNGDDVE